MRSNEFNYDATNVGGNTWMVKRWKDHPEDYTEALIEVGTIQPQEAVKAAIARDSWA